MDLWYPPEDQEPLLEWWLPLLLASAAARREQLPWQIHADEFCLRGRVDRAGRPAVWVYHHHHSQQELYLDDTGEPYKYTRTPNGRSHGRFTKIDIRRAVFAAGLHLHVEPVFYDEPPLNRYSEPSLPLGIDDESWPGDAPSPDPTEWVSARSRHAAAHDASASSAPPADRRRRRPRPGARRGHLTLIQGGRQAG